MDFSKWKQVENRMFHDIETQNLAPWGCQPNAWRKLEPEPKQIPVMLDRIRYVYGAESALRGNQVWWNARALAAEIEQEWQLLNGGGHV